MRGFVRRNQKIAASGARTLLPAGAFGIGLRDRALRLVPLFDTLGLGGRPDRAGTAITLKDYAPRPVG
ncbi:hypothetical protein ACFO4E_08930 [Nocardiopsis mangrovi]|uniref:Uncharacterized protein n=1 Tax=Nocardiopsis mangrovi TaxID=1179818 RepID=A0ABV9DTB3_9ACTN